MDELVCPASSCSSPSPTSFSAAAGHLPEPEPELELLVSAWDVVPEEWMDGNNDWYFDEPPPLDVDGDEGSRSAGNEPPAPPPAAAAPPKRRRGRKPGPRTSGGAPAVSHVEAERQRRDKLNRRFCELRAAVPTVSRMDKASLLADAAAYIRELRGRVAQLEADAKRASAAAATVTVVTSTTTAAAAAAAGTHSSFGGGLVQEKSSKLVGLEVRMVAGGGGMGPEPDTATAAMLRLTTTAAARHAPAHLMVALRSLDLQVQHACVCRVGGGGVTVQDAVVDVPAGGGLRDERGLRAALLQRLQLSGLL